MLGRRFSLHFTKSKSNLPWLTLSICLGLIFCFYVPPVFDLLYFERLNTENGEWWRLLSSQFVHLSPQHLLYNCAALFVVGIIIEEQHRVDFALLLLAGLVLVGGLLPFSQLDRYAGLSGALNALVLPAIWIVWVRSRSVIPLLVAALYCGRLLWEWASGASVLNSSLVWPSYTPAHLQGLAVGVAWLILRGKWVYHHAPNRPNDG